MHIGHVSRFERRGFVYRYRWPLVAVAVLIGAFAVPFAGASGPEVVIYPTRDFTQLPVGATASTNPMRRPSCVSIQRTEGSPKLLDRTCGSPDSTFRIIDRVSDVSKCLRDADQTYTWRSGSNFGAICLDYDWAANQCLNITNTSVSKVGCGQPGAVLPEMAIIGAVDVSYCREGGIAHSLRHFTVCTLAGKNCKGKPVES